MKTKILWLFLFFFMHICLFSQTKRDSGYVLSVEKDGVFIDLTSNDVKIGDKLLITKDGGYFTHPVTGKKIKKDDITVAYLEISQTYNEYSFAKVFPDSALAYIKSGIIVRRVKQKQGQDLVYKKTLLIRPFRVSGISGDYLGELMKDVFIEQLYILNKFKILDNDTGNMSPDYIISASAYPPEVVQISNDVPIKSIVNVAEITTGKNFGSDYLSNAQLTQLRAKVTVTIRIVDPKTGEIIYTFTRTGESVGKGSIELEGGIMNGLNIPGQLFYQSVSGKATQKALSLAANDIYQYLVNGKKIQYTNTVISKKLAVLDINTNQDSVLITLNKGAYSIYRLKNYDRYKIYSESKKSSHEKYSYIGILELTNVNDSLSMGLLNKTNEDIDINNFKIYKSKLEYIHPNFLSFDFKFVHAFEFYYFEAFEPIVGPFIGTSIFQSSRLYNKISLGIFWGSDEDVKKTIHLNTELGLYLNRTKKYSPVVGLQFTAPYYETTYPSRLIGKQITVKSIFQFTLFYDLPIYRNFILKFHAGIGPYSYDNLLEGAFLNLGIDLELHIPYKNLNINQGGGYYGDYYDEY